MKKLKFRYNGKMKSFDCPTHAALFREFFEYFKQLDERTAIEGTFESGLRLSDEEYFEGAVIKKKNLFITEDLYIITHITPQAMDKGIIGFLEGIGAEIIEPKQAKEKEKTPAKNNNKKDDKKEKQEELSNMAERVQEAMKKREEEIKARTMKNNETK